MSNQNLKMSLRINGKDMAVNSFVQAMISSAVVAMVGQLKGVEDPRQIDITIRQE